MSPSTTAAPEGRVGRSVGTGQIGANQPSIQELEITISHRLRGNPFLQQWFPGEAVAIKYANSFLINIKPLHIMHIVGVLMRNGGHFIFPFPPPQEIMINGAM